LGSVNCALTAEKVYIVVSPKFGELEGHDLVIGKALYGLPTTGTRWHNRFADYMSKLGFLPCQADPDISMRKLEDTYEYIAVYVDDLSIAMKKPKRVLISWHRRTSSKPKELGLSPFTLVWTSSGMKTTHCASHWSSTLRK
jgi:hypothetical protein